MNWWDTPEIEAAKKKALSQGAQGVFTLDQLRALGQTGDAKTDWMAGGKTDPNALIAGGGRAIIDQGLNLPAGYYRLPGMEGEAYHYDPRSGQVSQAFADWANSGQIERDPITNAPKALMDSRDGGEVFRAGYDQSTGYIKTINDILALGKGPDGSYQDAQDRVLGTGRYQQFTTDKNGKQIRVNAPPTGAAATDPAAATTQPDNKGAFDRLMKLTGQTREQVEGLLGGGIRANTALEDRMGSRSQADLENALAANWEKRATMWKGNQEQRSMRGLDPITGTSDAEKKRIYETYNRISDAGQKAAYIKYQDPGNLTPELRALRYAARAGEREMISSDKGRSEYQMAYMQPGKQGGSDAVGQYKINFGSNIMVDKVTGRETFVGNVPTSFELKKKQSLAPSVGKAITGAVIGLAIGSLTGGLGLTWTGTALTFLAGYGGAGGPMPDPKNIGFNKTSGWGQWKSSGPHIAGGKEIGTAIAFGAIMGGLNKTPGGVGYKPPVA